MRIHIIILLAILTALTNGARRDQVHSNGVASLAPVRDIDLVVGLPFRSRLVPVTSRALAHGRSHKVKFFQYHDHLPVYGSVLTAERLLDGSYTGHYRGEIIRDIEPMHTAATLSPREALTRMTTASGHHRTRHTIRNEESVVHVYLDANSTARLAYYVSYYIEPLTGEHTDDLPAMPSGFVDAHTGAIIDKWNGLASQSETSINGIGGNKGRIGKQVSSDLKVTLLDDRKTCQYSTARVQVQSLKGITGLPAFSPSTFSCVQATDDAYDLVNDGYSAANDAARYSEFIISMFQQYTGHNGPIDRLPLKARVHYSRNYENAFWDGAFMNIGDGKNRFYPLVALDVVAHEYAHGFTGSTSKLEYRLQSGGMNEAFSDMAGEAAEFFMRGTNDWLVGADIMKTGQALRFLCDPAMDGRSIDSATKYDDSLNVHYTSGVYNKAFCLLAKSPGWNTAIAFKVFARANTLYWGALTGYDLGACGVQHASDDLGLKTADVIAAFNAVGVRCR